MERVGLPTKHMQGTIWTEGFELGHSGETACELWIDLAHLTLHELRGKSEHNSA